MRIEYKSHEHRDRSPYAGSTNKDLELNLYAKGLPAILAHAELLVSSDDCLYKTDLVNRLEEEFCDIPVVFLSMLIDVLTGDDEDFFLFREDRFGILHSY